ncbi:MAG TPA: hypothetical protein VLL95_13995 [Phnomibacter sp.]|nr:hypothetical protein [Phnomibacter sp.]
MTVIVQPWSLYFQNDDFIYVSKAPLGHYLYRTAFRPVSDLTLRADYFFYGKNGGGFHVSNLLFHFLASVLLFFTARKWQRALKVATEYSAIAHMAGLLFLVYPFHSESLLWTIGRGGSLVTIFFLGALNLILTEPLRWQHWFGANLAFVIGLFTYESIWLLPLVATLLVWIKNDRIRANALEIRGLLIMWALLIISFAARKVLINDFIGSPYLNTTHFELSPLKQAYKFATGFCRSFLPPMENSSWFLAASSMLILALALILFRFLKTSQRRLQANTPLIIFLVTLLPVSILAVNTHTTESERFLYLPSAFLCLQAAVWINALATGWKRWIVLGVLGGYSVFYLNDASKQFRMAGNWNKTTLQEIARHEGQYKTVHVHELPASYKGAFMFRLGFEEALQWMCPGVQFDTLVIHSQQVVSKPEPLQVITAPDNEMKHLITNEASANSLYIIWNGSRLFVGSRKP